MATKRRRFIELRRAAGHTQESLAHALGHHRSTVERWENGRNSPQPWEYEALATELGVPRAEVVSAFADHDFNDHLRFGPPAVISQMSPTGHHAHDRTDILTTLDHARLLTDHTLSIGTASPTRLNLIEERVEAHVVRYTRTPPTVTLDALAPDIYEVQAVAAQRQPAAAQTRLATATATLALLTADALMKLGEINRARYWYGTARLAADDTSNLNLMACVRAQAAMLPYYYGDVQHAVALARAALAICPNTATSATALAAAGEARGLARLGDRDGAEQAMRRAEDLADALSEPTGDAAFRFNEKRRLLYLSGTLTYLGDIHRARRIQDDALARYRAQPEIVIDPALIRLDQAVGEALDGHAGSACDLATSILQGLSQQHRTQIVLTRARDVVAALPRRSHDHPAAHGLRELVAASAADRP